MNVLTDEEQKAALNEIDQGYIGYNKPKVAHVTEPDPDPNYCKRRKAAERLGLREEDLEDEQDNDAGSREEAWA